MAVRPARTPLPGSEAVAALLPDGRLHLQHGPIDLIIGADAQTAAGRQYAFAAAAARFDGLLAELVAELPLLRAQVTAGLPAPQGPIARRMHQAVCPHADAFITCMAAVAGAVADEILAAMTAAAPLSRAYVNNGGDIALHLTEGTNFTTAMAGLDGRDLGRIAIPASDGIRGIATSGAGGRSFSLGIADSVTVLARTAATADAAATMIANAVNLPRHPGIRRERACDLQPDSDLGARFVVTDVPPLAPADAARALDAGAARAQGLLARGLIAGAALFLQGQTRLAGTGFTGLIQKDEVAHAQGRRAQAIACA